MPAHPAFRYVLLFLLLLFALPPSPAQAAEEADFKTRLLAGPLSDCQEIVFAARTILPEHWYANIGYWATDANRSMCGTPWRWIIGVAGVEVAARRRLMNDNYAIRENIPERGVTWCSAFDCCENPRS
jgi:hypothetical protein